MSRTQGPASNLTPMLGMADDTDETGWDSRFEDFKAQALQERCGICCVVACGNCPEVACQDRVTKGHV